TAGLRLLDDRDRHFAEPLHRLRVVREQLQQAVRAGQARRAAADDRHADLDQLVLAVEAMLDELLLGVDRGREGRGRDLPVLGAVTGHRQTSCAWWADSARSRAAPVIPSSPSWPSPLRSASAGSC